MTTKSPAYELGYKAYFEGRERYFLSDPAFRDHFKRGGPGKAAGSIESWEHGWDDAAQDALKEPGCVSLTRKDAQIVYQLIRAKKNEDAAALLFSLLIAR